MSQPCCVYRVYDSRASLLYVGSSVEPWGRLGEHEQHSPWWPFKSEVEMEWFPDVAEARGAEKAAIATEHPRWNVVGRSPDHPDGPISHAYGRFNTPHLRAEVELWREWLANEAAIQRALNRRMRIRRRAEEMVADRSPTVRERKWLSLRALAAAHPA